MKQLKKWIWQKSHWPAFTWDAEQIIMLLGHARLQQGKLLAKMSNIGFELSREASAEVLEEETMKSAEIEGEGLNRDLVRSSVAKHLGLSTFGLPLPSRAIDGFVSILVDATINYEAPLTADRLKSWQAALFPTGYSGLLRIHAGDWRQGEEPMQVISGALGKETVHFEAVPSPLVQKEMDQFLSWWEVQRDKEDGLIRAGIAHFYFVTIHPFEDGNGRLARALTDMALAQDEKLQMRLYSLSSQIMKERSEYYKVLEKCQRGDGNITEWLIWFLSCYIRAVESATSTISRIISKADFWKNYSQVSLNERQRKVINLLLNAGQGKFEGGLTTRKYVSIAKVSRATAFREISDLIEKAILIQNPSKGRSVSYDLNWKH
ncbi:MAG: Fic family protein [Candidatus Protochlamydia sp.]|nr:Fic family protein [Candidatus Protochlamydia sp.]